MGLYGSSLNPSGAKSHQSWEGPRHAQISLGAGAQGIRVCSLPGSHTRKETARRTRLSHTRVAELLFLLPATLFHHTFVSVLPVNTGNSKASILFKVGSLAYGRSRIDPHREPMSRPASFVTTHPHCEGCLSPLVDCPISGDEKYRSSAAPTSLNLPVPMRKFILILIFKNFRAVSLNLFFVSLLPPPKESLEIISGLFSRSYS